MKGVKIMRKLIIAGLVAFGGLLLWSNYLFAAVGKKEDTQLWTNFTPVFRMGDKIQIRTNMGYRLLNTDPTAYRLHFRPRFSYSFNTAWRFDTAQEFIYQANGSGGRTTEVRPWQGMTYDRLLFSGWRQVQTLRVEERFRFRGGNTSGSDFQMRFRYRFSTTVPLFSIEKYSLSLPAYFELFVPAADGFGQFFINRNRLSAGFNLRSPSKNSIICRYIRQASRSEAGDRFSAINHVVLFAYQTNWQWRKD